jgi:hypothetical protein
MSKNIYSVDMKKLFRGEIRPFENVLSQFHLSRVQPIFVPNTSSSPAFVLCFSPIFTF